MLDNLIALAYQNNNNNNNNLQSDSKPDRSNLEYQSSNLEEGEMRTSFPETLTTVKLHDITKYELREF